MSASLAAVPLTVCTRPEFGPPHTQDYDARGRVPPIRTLRPVTNLHGHFTQLRGYWAISCREPCDGGLVEFDAKAGLVGEDHLSFFDRRGLGEQLKHPAHVFDGQTIRRRRDQLAMELRDHMADDRQI